MRRVVLILGLSLCASVTAQDPDHVFTMGSGEVDADAQVVLPLTYTITGGSQCQGFSLGVAHDPTLALVSGVAQGSALAGMDGGSGPDFFTVYDFPNGFAVGAVFSFLGSVTLPAGEHTLLDVTYVGGSDVAIVPLSFTDTLGSPMVETVTVFGGTAVIPVQVDGELLVGVQANYIRGDANVDGVVDISDGIQILVQLFVPGGIPSTCADATDVTADGTIDISDAVFLLGFLFAFGPDPAAPFPDCGSADLIGCEEYGACP